MKEETQFDRDFKDWFDRTHEKLHVKDAMLWCELTESMQWGVYIDFFLCKNILVETPFYWGANYWKVEISKRNIEEGEDYFLSRLIYEQEDFESLNEARESALEKAIEIYNQNTKTK
jgi:hypothetical protein